MKILVCVSQVPDTTTKITFANNNTEFNSSGVQFVINPYDEVALSKAVELTEGGKGTVTVITVGEADSEATIRKALAIGADDAVRINTKPMDAFSVATQIAHYAKDKNYDLILTGKESIDYNGAKVASMLWELLSIPSVALTKTMAVEGNTVTLEREIEGGKEVIIVQTPIVVGTNEGLTNARIPNMRGIMSARTKPLNVIEPLAVMQNVTFLSFESPAPRGNVKLISADNAKDLIQVLHQEAKVI